MEVGRCALEDAQAKGDEEEGESKCGKGVASQVAPEYVQGGLGGGHLEGDIHQLLSRAHVLDLLLIDPQFPPKLLLCLLGNLLLVQLE